MSKLITRIFTTTALLSAVGFTAFASNPFAEKADTNKDGLIQLSEFTAMANQKFNKMDINNNGLVTKAERKTFRAQMREDRALKKFASADSNSDGFISETEFMAARADKKNRMKKRRDVNGDGTINKEDNQARRKMRQHKRQHPDIDTNGDGAVDLAEHQAATNARFERMDRNGDGVLGVDEQKRPLGRRGKHGVRR